MTEKSKSFSPAWFRAQVQCYHEVYPYHEQMAHCLKMVTA